MSSDKDSLAENLTGDLELRAGQRIDYKLINSGSLGSEPSQDQYGALAAGFSWTNIDVQSSESLSEDKDGERVGGLTTN